MRLGIVLLALGAAGPLVAPAAGPVAARSTVGMIAAALRFTLALLLRMLPFLLSLPFLPLRPPLRLLLALAGGSRFGSYTFRGRGHLLRLRLPLRPAMARRTLMLGPSARTPDLDHRRLFRRLDGFGRFGFRWRRSGFRNGLFRPRFSTRRLGRLFDHRFGHHFRIGHCWRRLSVQHSFGSRHSQSRRRFGA